MCPENSYHLLKYLFGIFVCARCNFYVKCLTFSKIVTYLFTAFLTAILVTIATVNVLIPDFDTLAFVLIKQ